MKLALLIFIVRTMSAIFAASAQSVVIKVNKADNNAHNSHVCKQRKVLKLSGGVALAASHVGKSSAASAVVHQMTSGRRAWAMFGVCQVITILGSAIRRLVPIALQPFANKDLLAHHWVMFFASAAIMAYVEGYRAFHLKFAPLVVKRSFGLAERKGFVNCLLAGPFSMGLIGATRKRTIVSWGVSIGVFSVVYVVKKLPYPWRPIVDVGVISGLTVGSLSIVFHCAKALLEGKLPDIDPCF